MRSANDLAITWHGAYAAALAPSRFIALVAKYRLGDWQVSPRAARHTQASTSGAWSAEYS